MKNVLATILGFISAAFMVYVFETLIGQSLFPLPEGANPMDLEWIKNNMNQIPMGSKIFVVIAHFIGIILGMLVAAKICKLSMIPSYIVGAIMLAATFFYIYVLPKELWFTLSDGILVILGFIIGKSFAMKPLTTE